MKINFFKNYLLLFVAVIAVDQAVKLLMIQRLPAFVVYNTAGAWGIIPAWMTVGSVLSLFILVYFLRLKNRFIIFIIAAGISNLTDRVFHEGVVDYVHIGVFPVFNLADVIITISTVWLFITEIRNLEK